MVGSSGWERELVRRAGDERVLLLYCIAYGLSLGLDECVGKGMLWRV